MKAAVRTALVASVVTFALPLLAPDAAVYAYNKNNPRWEAPQHAPIKKFHKPYKPLRQPPGALPQRPHHGSGLFNGDVLLGLTLIVVTSIAAQWLAWSVGAPATLVLLAFGFVVGPAVGLVDPDVLLGNLFLPALSMALALIIFAQCAAIRFSALRQTDGVMANLITFGLLLSWLVGTGVAYVAAGIDGPLAILLGAILTASGTNVIAALIPADASRGLAGVLRWEARIGEVAGVALAILLFLGIAYGKFHGWVAVAVMGYSTMAGIAVGIVAAGVLITILVRNWVPDSLRGAVCAAFVLGALTLSNALRADSGLIAVIAMGLLIANQRAVDLGRGSELQPLAAQLSAVMLVVLAARLAVTEVLDVILPSLAVAAALVLIARPLVVIAATARLGLRREERWLLAWMAPRGVTTAALATLVGLRLAEIGYPQADRLAALSLLIVFMTVAFYSLAAARLARGLALDRPKGRDALGAAARP